MVSGPAWGFCFESFMKTLKGLTTSTKGEATNAMNNYADMISTAIKGLTTSTKGEATNAMNNYADMISTAMFK